jgi:hypothetical protein
VPEVQVVAGAVAQLVAQAVVVVPMSQEPDVPPVPVPPVLLPPVPLPPVPLPPVPPPVPAIPPDPLLPPVAGDPAVPPVAGDPPVAVPPVEVVEPPVPAPEPPVPTPVLPVLPPLFEQPAVRAMTSAHQSRTGVGAFIAAGRFPPRPPTVQESVDG